MKCFIQVLVLFFFSHCAAQTSLTGYVTLQNSGGKSAFPAQVDAFGATATDVDSENGAFLLVFDRKRGGQDAYLKIKKPGYEVVNKTDLSVRLPEEETNQRPVKFYLCPEGQWQRYADEYYEINLFEITRNYERELATLKRQFSDATLENQQYQKALSQLDAERQAAEARASELAETFALANLDEASDRYMQAHRLFTAGEIDSVLLILEEEQMLADLAEANEDIDEGLEMVRVGKKKVTHGEEGKEKVVEEFMIKARAHIIQLDWPAAERVYDLAIHADSLNTDNLQEAGAFLYDIGRYSKARELFYRCLRLASNPLDSSRYLNSLGILSWSNLEFETATKCLLQALSIQERLSKEAPLACKPYLSETLNNLGIVYERTNQLPEAINAYSRSVYLTEEMVRINPSYKFELAIRLNHLGIFYVKMKEFRKAETVYKQAIQIGEKLVRNDRQMHESYLATSYNNLGILYLEESRYEEARLFIQKALDIYERLVKWNPVMYEAKLAEALVNFSNIEPPYLTEDTATNALLRALALFEKRAAENPAAYLEVLTINLTNLGTKYMSRGEVDKAQPLLERAVGLYESLVPLNPEQYKASFASVLSYLGFAYRYKKDFEAADSVYQRSIQLYNALADEDPETYDVKVAHTLFGMGFYAYDRLLAEGDLRWKEKGLAWFEEALHRLQRYPDDFPEKIQLLDYIDYYTSSFHAFNPYLASINARILEYESNIEAANDPVACIPPQQQIVDILLQARDSLPENENVTVKLSQAYTALAWYLLFDKKYGTSLQLLEKAQAADPENAAVYPKLALAHLFTNDFSRAEGIYRFWKDIPYDEGRTFRDVFISDIEMLEEMRIVHPDLEQAKAVLEN